MGTDDNSRGPSRTFRREPWQTDSVALQACEAADLTEAQTIAVLAEQRAGLVKRVTDSPSRTCATCRFMGPGVGNGIEVYNEDTNDFERTEHGACARIIHGNCDGVGFRRVSTEPAVVTDGSGYAARLRVLPTFGCVLHEEREDGHEKLRAKHEPGLTDYGYNPTFRADAPRRWHDMNDSEIVIIKGQIVVPRPKNVVEMWEVP